MENWNGDGLARSRKTLFCVIPAEPVPEGGSRGAGIQSSQGVLDSRLSILRSRATAEDGRGSDN